MRVIATMVSSTEETGLDAHEDAKAAGGTNGIHRTGRVTERTPNFTTAEREGVCGLVLASDGGVVFRVACLRAKVQVSCEPATERGPMRGYGIDAGRPPRVPDSRDAELPNEDIKTTTEANHFSVTAERSMDR